MGNHVDKLAHLSYAEVPTAEPSSHAAEDGDARIGVSYIFSTEEEDDEPPETREEESALPPPAELECAVERLSVCVFERRDLRTHSADTPLNRCARGDLLEFVSAQQSPHWVVYVGQLQVVHLHRMEIKRSAVEEVARGRRWRVVSQLYRFEPLEAEAVVRNATEQLGLRERELSWRNSECFAAWCRFGRREFKAGGELRIGKQPYSLKLRLAGTQVHALELQSLEDAIMERRRRDRVGRAAVLRELTERWSGDAQCAEEAHTH